MRITELSAASGVAAPTIKYYVREGLLHDGERLSGNRTDYDESHVRRVRLIRALLETGGLSVAATKSVIAELDSRSPLANTFEVAQHALSRSATGTATPSEDATDRIRAVTASLGWRTSESNPGTDLAARVLDGFAAIDFVPSESYLRAYADAGALAARADLEALTTRTDPDAIAELMVVGTVLGDALAAGLRRLAQEDATADLFPARPADAASTRQDQNQTNQQNQKEKS
ncbi:MerR family transcriptional regulator [Herbiconiux sp. L3-i23]|uniref:MerR family transcriptional regulator n=1 Tax=Herbiconiux sp. L3-i23 TaxID=2905871 RepID=UPI00205525BB|nr:MerR family transcriptional regulator [Herbiconiux sp. L3-i23]BDI23335.1 MerR family transcriptional regulator [Herbiconiux sp. L3-i23]